MVKHCIHIDFLASAAPEVVKKRGDNSLSKLKMLYIQAKEHSESEAAYVHPSTFALRFIIVALSF